MADVLFGDYDYHRKLSFSWPRNTNDNFNKSDEHYEPLYPFAYALSLLE